MVIKTSALGWIKNILEPKGQVDLYEKITACFLDRFFWPIVMRDYMDGDRIAVLRFKDAKAMRKYCKRNKSVQFCRFVVLHPSVPPEKEDEYLGGFAGRTSPWPEMNKSEIQSWLSDVLRESRPGCAQDGFVVHVTCVDDPTLGGMCVFPSNASKYLFGDDMVMPEQLGMAYTSTSSKAVMDALARFDSHRTTCVRCSSTATSKCSICLSAMYCSKECQRACWATHKSVCKEIDHMKNGETEGFVTADVINIFGQ